MAEVAVYRYRPEQHHCREGMAIRHSDGRMFDTFWQSGGDAHVLTKAEGDTAVHLFNVADYLELDRYGRGTEGAWEKYHPDDRQQVTSQHGLQARWFVRHGAEPDIGTQIENARARVEEAESELRSAEWQLQWRRKHLAELEAKADPPVVPGATDRDGADHG